MRDAPAARGRQSFDLEHEQVEVVGAGGEILIVQYPGPTTGGRPIYDDRFNLQERREISAERIDR